MSDGRQLPAVTFVVPALNEAPYIEACLQSIQAEMSPNDELVVVDNGSTDGTLEIARACSFAEVLSFPEVTVAALRNRGAERAKGDILGFIDADCTLCPGWRRAVMATLKDPRVGAAGSAVEIPPDGSWIPRAWWSSYPSAIQEVPHLVAANFAVRRELFESIGGFAENMVTDEDTEIGARVREAGYSIVDTPQVRVLHHDNPSSLLDFYRKERWHATSILARPGMQNVDKPLLMTFVFVAGLAVAVASLGLVLTGRVEAMWGLLAVFVAPALTAAYRLSQVRRWEYVPHWMVLYSVFYWARTTVLGCELGRRVLPRRS